MQTTTHDEIDPRRFGDPLFSACGPYIRRKALKARDLIFEPCAKDHAVQLVRLWHSRLPNCQCGPWQFAFRAHLDDVTYAVALWNNPSARTLPCHWLELRRMACSKDVPFNTCSRFLAFMVRYFRSVCPEREKCISYQDKEVHFGTIYKASGWIAEFESEPRIRDRSKARIGTRRDYRSSINGKSPDCAGKIRWSMLLDQKSKAPFQITMRRMGSENTIQRNETQF